VMRALWVMMTMVMMMMTEASLCGWRVCWKYRPGTERASMRYIPCCLVSMFTSRKAS